VCVVHVCGEVRSVVCPYQERVCVVCELCVWWVLCVLCVVCVCVVCVCVCVCGFDALNYNFVYFGAKRILMKK